MGNLGWGRAPRARRSADIFRFQPFAAITKPASVGININIVTAVSTGGGIHEGVMIGGGFRQCVLEMKSDSAAISSPVFNHLRFATLDLPVCPMEKVLEFRGSHFLPHAPVFIKRLNSFGKTRRKLYLTAEGSPRFPSVFRTVDRQSEYFDRNCRSTP